IHIIATFPGYFNKGHGYGSPQKFKNNGYRGGSGHPYRIEEIQQQDIGNHYGHENDHDFAEHELSWVKDSLSGYLHHTTGKNGTYGNTQTGHDHNGLERNGLGPNGGI